MDFNSPFLTPGFEREARHLFIVPEIETHGRETVRND